MHNPKTHHKRLCQFNSQQDGVRKRRINKEMRRVKLARASFIPAPRLVHNQKVIKVLIRLQPKAA